MSLAKYAAILEQHELATANRFIDMVFALRICDARDDNGVVIYDTTTDEEVVRVGGVWDRVRRRWAKRRAAKVRVIRVPRGSDQEEPARWLGLWLRLYAQGKRGPHWEALGQRVYTMMMLGGRRGGKTHLAMVFAILFAILVPRALVWAISPTQDETDELDAVIAAIIPARIIKARLQGASKIVRVLLANGSRIVLRSGHKASTLKAGRVDVAIYNEAQKMSRKGWNQIRGGVADRSGLVVLPCNPPDLEIGRWVDDLFTKARGGGIAVQAFHVTARSNPFVDWHALEAMRDELSDLDYRREILGEIVPIGDVVMHEWRDYECVRVPPAHYIDVTPLVTQRHLNHAAAYVIGADFQKTPHMAATVHKFFCDPALEPTDENVETYVVAEFIVENADEDMLLDALEGAPAWQRDGVDRGPYRGWREPGDTDTDPKHAVVVMDASGWWQDGEHSKGVASDKRFAQRNWRFCYRPQRDAKKNPLIAERVKLANARLRNANGKRRYFLAPQCERLITAFRRWERINGHPKPGSVYSHGPDSSTYVIYRFFGRVKPRHVHTAEYVPVHTMERERLR